ncbi:hypothetical protein LCGC14_1486520 [marine sediment metagenome]|uniref:VWFA domain-containing protein n=1 Tax=marine sediment metagenome TaxID=412755 RepID=A0A0F9LNP5_9ZZZZ
MTDKLKSLLQDAPEDSSSSVLATEQGEHTASVPTSDTVLKMDRWGRRRGREIAERWHDIGDYPTDEADPYPSDTVADAHSSLFDAEPVQAENPSDTNRAAWWDQFMETPEYSKLHRQTCLDPTLSALGAKHIVDEWQTYAAECPKPQEGDPAPGSDEEPIEQTLERIRSCSKALQEASETVEEAKDTAAGLGLGGEGGQIDAEELAKYFQKIRNDEFLRKVMAMAGRMRAMCQALQRTKLVHGQDDTVGIELGGDISRLVPSELAQLACEIPELELLALDRVARRQALCRKYRGIQRLGRGPIVVVVDESGSMRQNNKIVAAKALALTMAWLARQQKRWIALVGFAGGTEGIRIAFPPGKMDQDKLIEWLQHFYGGGTTLDVPLDKLPNEYWSEFQAQGLTKGQTDVVLITDAIVKCPDEMRDKYLKWAKDEQVRSYGIVIGSSDAGDLAAVCDQHWCLPSLDLDNPAVETILSM